MAARLEFHDRAALKIVPAKRLAVLPGLLLREGPRIDGVARIAVRNDVHLSDQVDFFKEPAVLGKALFLQGTENDTRQPLELRLVNGLQNGRGLLDRRLRRLNGLVTHGRRLDLQIFGLHKLGRGIGEVVHPNGLDLARRNDLGGLVKAGPGQIARSTHRCQQKRDGKISHASSLPSPSACCPARAESPLSTRLCLTMRSGTSSCR